MSTEPDPTPHRLDWNGWKGIARCTACSWVERAANRSQAVDLHRRHVPTRPPKGTR